MEFLFLWFGFIPGTPQFLYVLKVVAECDQCFCLSSNAERLLKAS